jgi:hypothetical protein
MTSAIQPDRYVIGDVDIDWLKEDFTAAKTEIEQNQTDIALKASEADLEIVADAAAAALAAANDAETTAEAALNKVLMGAFAIPDLVTRQGQVSSQSAGGNGGWAAAHDGTVKYCWGFNNAGSTTLYIGDNPFLGTAYSPAITAMNDIGYFPVDQKFYLAGFHTSTADILTYTKAGTAGSVTTSDITTAYSVHYSPLTDLIMIAGATNAKSGILTSPDGSSFTYTQLAATASLEFKLRESETQIAAYCQNTSSHRFIYTTTDGTSWTSHSFSGSWSIVCGDFEPTTGDFYALFNVSSALVLKKTSDFTTWTDVYTWASYSNVYMRFYKSANCFVLWGTFQSALCMFIYSLTGGMTAIPRKIPAYTDSQSNDWSEDTETGILYMRTVLTTTLRGLWLGV